MIIVSIDPALSFSGICVKEDDKIIYVDTITTKYGDIKNKTEEEKIFYICTSFINICKSLNVELILTEDQFVGGLTSKKTAMQLSRLRGALNLIAMLNSIQIKAINTNSINKKLEEVSGVTLGKEIDKKERTYHYVKEIYKNNSIIESLGTFNDKPSKEKNSDIFDAIGISIVHGCTR